MISVFAGVLFAGYATMTATVETPFEDHSETKPLGVDGILPDFSQYALITVSGR